jgi:hypothetical protein
VAFVAVWFVALRPKPVPVNDTPLAPIKQIPKAKAAAAASDAANAKLQAAAGRVDAAKAQAPAAAATPAAATPAVTSSKPAVPVTASKPSAASAAKVDASRNAAVLRDFRAKKVVVMLFWNAKGADDIATRGVIRGLNRHHGKVAVHIVPITRVGQYDAVTRGVHVVESPTVVIIDRKRHTRVITGLTEPQELDQAVGDALAGR